MKSSACFPYFCLFFPSISVLRTAHNAHTKEEGSLTGVVSQTLNKAYVVRGHEGSLVVSRYDDIIWLKIGYVDNLLLSQLCF